MKEHRPQAAQANEAFLGTIENRGHDNWETVEILIELFDKDGTFVDKCSSYLDGTIAPGQTRNFKVSCSGGRESAKSLAYDHYTVAVVGANYVQPEVERR